MGMKENDAKRPKVAMVGGGRSAGRTLKAQLDLLEELEAYRAIGTIDEFKALKEKSEPKKTNSFGGCIHNNVERDWDFMK